MPAVSGLLCCLGSGRRMLVMGPVAEGTRFEPTVWNVPGKLGETPLVPKIVVLVQLLVLIIERLPYCIEESTLFRSGMTGPGPTIPRFADLRDAQSTTLAGDASPWGEPPPRRHPKTVRRLRAG